VKYLSLFAFSEENWNRPDDEVTTLMGLMVKAMADEMDSLDKNGVRFVVLGNRDRLDPALNETIDACMKRTEKNETLVLIIFLSYSGKWDILQAAKKLALELAADPEKREGSDALSISDFDRYLVTAGVPDPDLIVRTSGEHRLSNYLLWQSAYSEFYFTETLWPDFRKVQFREALNSYAKRDRRYGKVK
jgi:undecaprenyl diphosphate synthase